MEEKSEPPPSYNEAGGQQYQQQGGYYPQGQYQAPGQYPQQQYGGQYGGQQYGGQPVVTSQPTTVVINAGPLANPPPDHLAYAIFVTICCCWPIGIFAILKSMECRDAIARGDAQMASVKSQEAKRFSNITLGVGIAMVAVAIAIVVVYVVVVVSAINS